MKFTCLIVVKEVRRVELVPWSVIVLDDESIAVGQVHEQPAVHIARQHLLTAGIHGRVETTKGNVVFVVLQIEIVQQGAVGVAVDEHGPHGRVDEHAARREVTHWEESKTH